MSKENILLVHNYYQIPGGEDVVVENEKAMLEKNGHKVTLYTRHNDEIKNLSMCGKVKSAVGMVYSRRTIRDIENIIKDGNIDIIHVHNTFPLISPSIYSVAARYGIPVVQTVHNFRLVCPGGVFYRDRICTECVSKRSGLWNAIRHKCYRNSFFYTLMTCIMLKYNRIKGTYSKASYICLTEFNKKQLLTINKRHEYINPDSVYVKPNFTYETDIDLKHIEVDMDTYVYVGRLEELKGTRVLLEAFRGMPDKKLLVIGSGAEDEYYREACKRYNNIVFMGNVSHEKVLKMVAGSAALILPSQCYESFGIVIIEAFSVGTPVICANIGNFNNIVKDNMNGLLFQYDSVDSLREKVKCMTRELRSYMSKNAIQTYRENYSPERNYEILESIYEKVRL